MVSSDFEHLPVSGLLMVPLSLRPAPLEAVELRIGQRVDAAAALSSGALDLSHVPLAPVAGETRQVQYCPCNSLHTVAAMPLVLEHTASIQTRSLPPNLSILERLAPLRREVLPEWIEHFRNAGIHADRRASPGLIAQLVQSIQRPVDAVICCVVDSDPAAMLLHALASAYQKELIAGVAAIARLTGASRCAFACSGAMRWQNGNRKLRTEHSIHELVMSGDYPLADPSLLLWACLGRKLRPGRLPTEVGALVLDAAAAIAVGRFVLMREPMLCVPIAVHDWSAHRCRFVMTPIGASVRDVLAHLQINAEQTTLRVGDSLRDRKIGCDTMIAGGELVFHISPLEPPINPEPCIRCGWCVEVCPTGVQPAGVLEAAQRQNVSMAERMGVHACIDCGLCSYVCPSKLPLLGAIREMRTSDKVTSEP